MSKISKQVVVLALALALSACAKDRTIGASSSYVISDLKELPAPSVKTTYVIAPQDQIQIDVMGVKDLTGVHTVGSDGSINFPLIGNIGVGGKTPNQIAQDITSALKHTYLKNPQVWVSPKSIRPLTISIGGEVVRPGNYPVTETPSLIHAINFAGGPTRYADEQDVIIMRTVNGQNYIGLYNIEAIERGNYENPKIYAGDIITIGYSNSSQWIRDLVPISQLLYTSVIIYDRLTN